MTFLEFFEALIGCAEIYVTEQLVLDATTRVTSVDITIEQSMLSIPESSSFKTSQVSLCCYFNHETVYIMV